MMESESEPKGKRVVAGVLVHGDSILVGWRKDGKCDFPGGKAEMGEDLDSAVVREYDEETGIRVVPGRILDVSEHDYGGDVGLVRVHFIECRAEGSVVLKEERYREVYKKVDFVKITEAPKLDWLEADKQFVRDLAVAVTGSHSSMN